jgi:hypothetical protein
MNGTNYAEWERSRSELNHNWLSNNYLIRLKSLQSYLHDLQVIDKQKYRIEIKRLMSEEYPQWEEKKSGLYNLLIGAEIELSPCKLFDRLPLMKLNNGNKVWLREVSHHLWLVRNNVKIKIDDLLVLWSSIDILYTELKTEYSKYDIMKNKIPSALTEKLGRFISLCGELHLKLSRLTLLEKAL